MPRDSEIDFRTKLDAAREWEVRLARWVRSRGWFVVPTYDFSGKGEDKAPKLLAPIGQRDLVLPDLQCFRNGELQWLECKWKARADRYRIGGYDVTGISKRLFDHYQQVQKATGARVVLAFLHEMEMEMRGDALDALGDAKGVGCFSHVSQSARMGRMIFWRYDAIPRWAHLGAVSEQQNEPRRVPRAPAAPPARPLRLVPPPSNQPSRSYRPEHGEVSPEEEARIFGSGR